MGNKPKEFDFVHQTVSRREARAGGARDYSFPGSKRRRRKGLVLAVCTCAHVLISGRVPMTPSKWHGQLHDIAIHHINWPNQPTLASSFYLSAFAKSLALFVNEDLQQKGQTKVQWWPKLPFAMVLSVGSPLVLTNWFYGASAQKYINGMRRKWNQAHKRLKPGPFSSSSLGLKMRLGKRMWTVTSFTHSLHFRTL